MSFPRTTLHLLALAIASTPHAAPPVAAPPVAEPLVATPPVAADQNAALRELADATSNALRLGIGLSVIGTGVTGPDRTGWFRPAGALLPEWAARPEVEFLLGETRLRYRDLNDPGRRVIASPTAGLPADALVEGDFLEDQEVVGLKHVIARNRFQRTLSIGGDPWIIGVEGNAELHSPTGQAFVEDLAVTLSTETGGWTTDFFARVRYISGRHSLTTEIDGRLGALPWLGDGATGLLFVQDEDGELAGILSVDYADIDDVSAFSTDGHLVYRTGGAGPSGPAPDFTLPDADGNQVSLSDERFADKVVLVNFCASWCAPCRDEFPELRRLRSTYGAQGLEIITIGSYEPAEDTFTLGPKFALNFPLLATDGGAAVPNAFGGVPYIPTTYVLDRDHQFVTELVGGHKFEYFEYYLMLLGFEYTRLTDGDGDGWYLEDGDCDDANGAVHPNAWEVANDGTDADCDGDQTDGVHDDDGDGWFAEFGDCDDSNPATNRGAPETDGDGVDSNCDGLDDVPCDVRCNDETVPAYYACLEAPPAEPLCGDPWEACVGAFFSAHGACLASCGGDLFQSCKEGCVGECLADDACYGFEACYFGYDLTGQCFSDCIAPGDADGDGHYVGHGDCDDSDPTIHPGAPETDGDGVDSNCDGEDDNPPLPCDYACWEATVVSYWTCLDAPPAEGVCEDPVEDCIAAVYTDMGSCLRGCGEDFAVVGCEYTCVGQCIAGCNGEGPCTDNDELWSDCRATCE